MVFEAVVVEFLNKFLKQYVENLNTSQLKIGIWGGDVALNDLIIKTTLFDGLNLPVRVKWGKLGKFVMKIPWKNLYSSQVVINIQDMFMVIVPNSEFTYDPVKEEKWTQDRKQAKLKIIEEAKKRELEVEAEKQNDGFLEKLLTQITKNLQIVIKNVHFRYEDKTTIPGSPFSFGVTLSNLSVETTVNDRPLDQAKGNENFICKVINLEGLSIYWNSCSALFSELSESDLVNFLLNSIPKTNYKPDGFLYLFGPLSASVFLRLNPKPETDESNFTIPKFFINVHLKEIELAITHNQFCDVMSFLQDFQRLTAGAKYRKYRPVKTPVTGNAKKWWHFAYQAVVEDIARRKKEWCWDNIQNHRKMCRKYSDAFKIKLTSKKISKEVEKELNELEKNLNLFNLILIREQVYMEVERSKVKENAKSSGWFSSWFGFGGESESASNEGELVKKIESVMTTHEKEKLYKAIGYEESAPLTNYPVTFVEVKFLFHLDAMEMTIYDDQLKNPVPIMKIAVKPVKMEFEQRPSASAFKFVLIIGRFQVTGTQEKDETYPELITSNCKESESLIELLYETKPLNASCDLRIIVNARPLSIIFHASTINLVVEVFTTDAPENMEKIMAATSASLPTFQKITSRSLQYAIEKQTIMEVKVNIMASHLIIPYKGVYHPDTEMLVLLLGRLSIETERNIKKDGSVKKLFLEGNTDEEIFSAVVSASYTKFKCFLTGVQILFQLTGENWVVASKQEKSPMQFLEPTNLEVTIKKSLVTDDARIPRMIVEGKLPSLTFNFSEERFVSFIGLACSISATTTQSPGIAKKNIFSSNWSIYSLGAQLENSLVTKAKEYYKSSDYVQGIYFVGHFEMNELVVNVNKSKVSTAELAKKQQGLKAAIVEEKFLNLCVMRLEIEFTSKTFETITLFKLGGLDFKQLHHKALFPFVYTKLLDYDYYIFAMEFINLDTKIPDFYTARDAIISRLTLNIKPINLVLNKEALVALLQFVSNVQRRVEVAKENCPNLMADFGKAKEILLADSLESGHFDKKIISKGKRFRKKRFQKEVIDFFLQASLDELDVISEVDNQGLAEFNLKGGSVDISTRKSCTTFDVNIREIFVLDLDSRTKHKKIVASLEKQTLSSRITLYNKEYFGPENTLDMSVDAEVGGIECTFLNVFFARAFEFLSVFETRIQTLKEGATIAAQKARENMVKAFQNLAQICLNIKITAPLLLIPKTSDSLETLTLDMGVLTMKNYISELDYSSSTGTDGRPLIDTSKLHLQNLKVSRYILNEDCTKTECETTFLIPVTFELTVKRNLSSNWFKLIPDLEVLARLAKIHVTLTHEDLCAIVDILDKNFKEGNEIKQNLKQSAKNVKNELKSSQKKESKIFFHQGLITDEKHIALGSSEFNTVIKFGFFLDSFIFDALTKSPKESDNEEGNVGLARFVLEAMSLKGRMFSDDSIYTSVILASCLLDDTRPGKEGRLTRLMERTSDTDTRDSKREGSSTSSMFELTFQRKEKDTFVDMRVFKFTLILSMDFLQKLLVFFTLDTVEGSGNTATYDERKYPTKIFVHKSLKKSEEDDDDDADEVNDVRELGNEDQDDDIIEDETEVEQPPTFTINLRLEKPDIIVVESMDSINTDAFIFHAEMIVKNRIAGTRRVITATLSEVEIYSCCFNPSKRSQTLNQIIKPFTVSVAGSTPEESGLHIDICLTEIYISINPNTVDLMSKCYRALLRDSFFKEENTEEADYSDLWDVKPFDPENYWFLRADEGIDALSTLRSSTSLRGSVGFFADEICLLAIPLINISLEGLSTVHASPLLLLEMGFQMQCYNWSQKANVLFSLTIKMDYYNKVLCAWEPFIEPVEKYSEQSLKHTYIPWELNCSLVVGDEGELEGLRPPKLQITLSCSESLQLTVSKTCLDVLKHVGEIYTAAAKRHIIRIPPNLPPVTVKNDTGLVVELLLEKSKLQMLRSLSDSYDIIRLEANSEVELEDLFLKKYFHKKAHSFLSAKKDSRLYIKFPIAGDTVFELPLSTNCKRYYTLPVGEYSKDEVWGFVIDVSIVDDSTTVVLRSVLKVTNYFTEPVNVHFLAEDGNVAEYVGTVEGNSSFCLPLRAVYNPEKTLFFSVNGYSLSNKAFVWKDLKKELKMSSLLQCLSKDPENGDPFFIQVFGETSQVYFGNTNRKTLLSMTYHIHLQPTVKIYNSLPVPLVICFQGSAKEKILLSGNSLQISNAEPGSSALTLRISDYLEKEWSCKKTIPVSPTQIIVWKFVSYNGLAPEFLNLGSHVTYKRETAVYTIYCPYFMVNKTEHLLAYKFENSSTVFYHPGDLKIPLMFSPTSEKFLGKKLAKLQVNSSSWSDKFPVDVAGSGGTVECEDTDSKITFKISVTITLSYNSLTKIVVFSPFFVLFNSLNYPLEYQESDFSQEPMLTVAPNSCIPFWPRSQLKEKSIFIKLKDSDFISPPFAYESTDVCLLKMPHKCGGIFVSVKGTQSGTFVTFSPYEPGQAPALIINFATTVVNLYEQDTKSRMTLKPYEQVMLAWANPMGARKLILLNQKDVISLDEDSDGLILTSKGEAIRYATFLDGTQRILLFTDSRRLLSSISSMRMMSSSGVELICKIQGVGVSLVNNINSTEILYLAFISSGIVWESRKIGKTRFKQMRDTDSSHLEKAYQKYKMDSNLTTNVNPLVIASSTLKVNFEKMELIEPNVRELKRTFEPGLWLAVRQVDEETMLHLKVNKIQIDNQLQNCVFPVILAPVPPPKTVAAAFEGTKPFIEMSIVKVAADKRGVQQYKYFKTLVQEFHVKIDIGFLRQTYLFAAAEEMSDEMQKINFNKDLEFIRKPLQEHIEVVSSNESKSFYELLHFPPLKIHFSFSLAGKIEEDDSLPPTFKVMMQTLGVTLTDIHDVIFRLSYLERKNVFLTNSQLVNEGVSHYFGQIVRQGYVLVFGLDVIGNPYGLIVGIGRGVEAFFYEPFMGMIQGPAEFRAGMAIGCKRLFSHTVGSAAGTLGKLTETLGKGLAVLSLDKEYQMQRMVEQNRSDNIQASMARGGRGLVMGVVEGVKGVVQKPIKGAKEEGVGGFIKGMGKGMMGLVTRPVTGVVDFAATSFNAVRRANDMSSECKRLRPPRFFRDDTLVRPYNLYEAEGNEIFYAICKVKYWNSDKYDYHLFLKENEVVVLTNKRIILAELSETFSSWQEHLVIPWKAMPDRPRCHTKGVALTMPQKSGLSGNQKPEIKVLIISKESLREEICKKMVELYNLEKELHYSI